MKQIKQRLYSLYALVVAVFILLLSFLLRNVVEDQLIIQQRMNLTHEMSTLVTYIKEENAQNELDRVSILKTINNISRIMNKRVTFIDTEGTPLFDSEVPIDELKNQIETKEIQEILLGNLTGIARRRDSFTKTDQYYVAQGIFNEDEALIGILRISSEVREINDIIEQVLIIQLSGTLILIFVIIGLTNQWLNRIAVAVADMNVVVTDLTHAHYETRYYGHSYPDFNQLGESINELALNLDNQQQQLTSSEERTIGLINHLIIGVMLLDTQRRIQMVNPALNELLGINLYDKISHLYTDYIRSAELIELIEESISRDEMRNAEIKNYIPEEKTIDVNVIPVPGQQHKSYIVLLYDITEIKRLERVRTEFAANVSHELRTPITALKGFSETLLDGAMYDEEVLKEFLEVMLIESTRLDSMVQDILHLSRLEQGQKRYSREWVSVREIAEEVFQILQQKIELQNINYYIEVDNEVVIYANRNLLKQILMNLIANAVSYTPELGTVIVDIDKDNDEAIIQVVDNGIGIPEEDQARIFERFYRIDKARSRNSGGTGLGLSIVKWVVESMNGKIELFSEENIGSIFVVRLPLGNQAEAE